MSNISSLGKNCCGCTACEQICPKNCIEFKYDSEGFLYPIVDEAQCVDCSACVNHCPILTEVSRGENPDVYAAKLNDKQLVQKSTSGGIFIPLAKNILNKGGAVFGCAYDENLTAKHIKVESKAYLHLLQGSKYVQSNLQGIYTQVKSELIAGRKVLFSGTGCQVAGLKTFLKKDYENLLTIDIVCHGVPSPKLFENYINWLGSKLGEKITAYNFRSKEKYGWGLFYKAETQSKSKSDDGFFDPYYNAFLNCRTYRESCYSCKFANSNRPADITLADFWGIESVAPSFYSKSGVSLVLVNTNKGREAWNSISGRISALDSNINQAVKMNKNLSAPSKRPDCRDTIYDGFDGDFDKYVQSKLAYKNDYKRRLKAIVPVSLKGRIKHMLKK